MGRYLSGSSAQAVGKVKRVFGNVTLTSEDSGLILVDATSQTIVITLPAANPLTGASPFVIRRVDDSTNSVRIQSQGTDLIKFHTHLNSVGYGFFYLMGAGDWWEVQSDQVGNWWPMGRFDNTPLGRPVFETTTVLQPGGWSKIEARVFQRTAWPWLWDHAQMSGMLTSEATRVGREGCWTTGDGNSTFRAPDGRGEFLRLLDDSRGIDASRTAGSYQASQNLLHGHTGTAASAGAHTHGVGYGTQTPNGSDTSGQSYEPLNPVNYPGSNNRVTGSAGDHTHNITLNDSGGTEARPRNIAWPGRMKII